MKGKRVECEPKTTDRYGRTAAPFCRADGIDLGASMSVAG
jgi:endonuclease YncB( thermonuclease family)